MNVKILLAIPLMSCNNYYKKASVPKPIISDIVFDFREINTPITENGKIYLDKQSANDLLYNIRMSRIYYNQQVINNKLITDYYESIIKDMGGEIV